MYKYDRFVYVPDPLWLGWRDRWRMADCAFELVDCELAKLDRLGRRPGRSRRWRAPRPFLNKLVRRVMPKLRACLKHRQAVPYRGARDAWHGDRRFPKTYRAQLKALDHLMNGIGTVIYGKDGVYREASPASHFKQLCGCLTLSKAEVEEILIRHRLDDFTVGRGVQIKDEDVGLACLAACEVGKYEIAYEIALRGLISEALCTASV